ncbi:MAG: Grx4 family monothiol glutaredoxin [Acidobacteria bacterium]|nr:Grx4 family monothiol glutaredoxin [Acidobacteriota bacterium]
MTDINSWIDNEVKSNDVVLFMKGTPDMPRCGFSMRTVAVLEQMGVEYGAIDVLPVMGPLREVTAEISDWQTFPQVYIDGELVGGCDIVEEMFESGELADALGVPQPETAETQMPANATEAGLPAQSPPMQIET